MHPGLAAQVKFAAFRGAEDDAVASFAAVVDGFATKIAQAQVQVQSALDQSRETAIDETLAASWNDRATSWVNAAQDLVASIRRELPLKTDDSGVWTADGGYLPGTVDTWIENRRHDVDLMTSGGVQLLGDGARLASQLRNDTLANYLTGLADELPGAIGDVWNGVVAGVKKTVSDVVGVVVDAAKQATLGAINVAIIAGAGLALVIYMLTKAGAKVNTGPVKFGAMRGQRRRVAGHTIVRGRLRRMR